MGLPSERDRRIALYFLSRTFELRQKEMDFVVFLFYSLSCCLASYTKSFLKFLFSSLL